MQATPVVFLFIPQGVEAGPLLLRLGEFLTGGVGGIDFDECPVVENNWRYAMLNAASLRAWRFSWGTELRPFWATPGTTFDSLRIRCCRRMRRVL